MRFIIFHIILVITAISLRSQNFITPVVLTGLPPELNETSGLVNLDGEIWTHNDNGDGAFLYRINVTDGSIIRTVTLTNASNVDWEDICCDDTYVYIGDFGNNYGDRTNLRIYRISRSDLAIGDEVEADKIKFAYSDQVNFEPNYHYTNYDCEAMIWFQGFLYLFTKNWIDQQTNVYKLPASPGNHIADYMFSYGINCLVTGAEIVTTLNTLLLSGYNTSGGTYTWLFSGFQGNGFFSGTSTKLIWTTLTQTEGICYAGNTMAYACTEKFQTIVGPTLFRLDLSDYLTSFPQFDVHEIDLYISGGKLILELGTEKPLNGTVRTYSPDGRILVVVKSTGSSRFEIGFDYPNGIYIVQYSCETFNFSRKIILVK